MGKIFLFFLLSLILEGVFCDTVVVSVKGGDSVTLHADSQIQKGDVIYWKFGPQSTLIARLNKLANIREINEDKLEGKFKGRLKLEQTGDLTIKNIMTSDSGQYEVSSDDGVKKSFNVSVVSVDSTMTVSVLEGDLVTLPTDVLDIKIYNAIQWRFNHQKSPVAEIKAGNVPKYDETDKRFKGKLQLDPQTGSLTIKNIRTEQAGLYEVDISSSGHTTHKSYNVASLVPKCGPSGWSSGAVAGIVVGLLILLVAVAVALVIYYRRKIADLEKLFKGNDVLVPKPIHTNNE